MKKLGLMILTTVCLGLLPAACRDKPEKPSPTRPLTQTELWERAQTEGTIESLEAYLDAYPEGERSLEAKRALRELWDHRAGGMTAQELSRLTAVLETDQGTIRIRFFAEDAPNTARNFIKLAMSRFYDGLVFHRVIADFVIQTGCPDGTGRGGPGYTIPAEFNSRPHLRGTVAMARTSDPNSAGSQFYICLSEQEQLNNRYTVFGQVIEGMETVDKISGLPTHRTRLSRGIEPPADIRDQDLDRPLAPPRINRIYLESW